MGLFGKIARKAKDGSLMNGFQAAQALSRGDYAGAAQINAMGARMRAEREQARAEAEQIRQLHATIDADPTLSTPEAKAYAKANPKAYAEAYLTRFQTRQFGAAGGSIGTPGPGGQMTYQQAPSRHEYQGSVYDVGPTVPGQKATVTAQHEGTQWVTPQPGTNAFPVNSFTGADRTGTGSPGARAGPAPPVLTDDDILKLDAQGGAGRSAPRTFPGGY